MAPGVEMSTAPRSDGVLPREHWLQCVWMLPTPLPLVPGDVVWVRVSHDDHMVRAAQLVPRPSACVRFRRSAPLPFPSTDKRSLTHWASCQHLRAASACPHRGR